MKRFLLLLFLFSCFVSLFADEEIVVRLNSKETLAPLYLHFFQKEPSGFDATYLKQIEDVLLFDLTNNGKTDVVEADKRLQQQANSEEQKQFNLNKWQALGVDYVVKASIRERKLSLSVLAVKTGQIKGLQEMPLSGKMASDRSQMHRAADAIHLALFSTSGIANTRILFTVRTRKSNDPSSWVTEVWESDYDGGNAHQITHDAGLCVTPAYIPSATDERCRHILYVSYKVGQPKIYTASTQGGKFQRLSYLKGNQLMPAISPQKNSIAFVSDVAGNPDLFVQDFSFEKGPIGKPRQVFAAPKAAQGTPSFSPDGERLAFVSNKDGTPRIYCMDIPPRGASIKEVKPVLISKRNRENTAPAWSPDGSKIAYAATTNGIRQIWIYDCETHEEMQLTEGQGHKENPVWAPNSLHLLFNSSTPTSSELYLINLNQKKAVRIATTPGEKRFPAWEPLVYNKNK